MCHIHLYAFTHEAVPVSARVSIPCRPQLPPELCITSCLLTFYGGRGRASTLSLGLQALSPNQSSSSSSWLSLWLARCLLKAVFLLKLKSPKSPSRLCHVTFHYVDKKNLSPSDIIACICKLICCPSPPTGYKLPAFGMMPGTFQVHNKDLLTNWLNT